MTRKKDQFICDCAGICHVLAAEGCTHGVNHVHNDDCTKACGVNCDRPDCKCVLVRLTPMERRKERQKKQVSLLLKAVNQDDEVFNAFEGVIISPECLEEMITIIKRYVNRLKFVSGVSPDLDGRRCNLPFDFIRLNVSIHSLWAPVVVDALAPDGPASNGISVISNEPPPSKVSLYWERPYRTWMEIHALVGEPGVRLVCRRKRDADNLECRTHCIPLSSLVKAMEEANQPQKGTVS